MSRAKFQVLVIPYQIVGKSAKYCILKRESSTGGYWQWIAGGGENSETPLDAAVREAFEEAGINRKSNYIQLQSMVTIPVVDINGFQWGPETLVVPEYCFSIQFSGNIMISKEHSEFKWVDYEEAMKLLKWDSNKSALWEINHIVTTNLDK